MAHEIDETTGQAAMAYTGQAPWHGLGQELPVDATLEQWRVAAKLDWEVVKTPVTFTGPDGEQYIYDGRYVLARNDTAAPLGIVSADYRIVQPATILEFYSDLVEKFGFRLETAGALKGGQRIWALANTGQAFAAGGLENDLVKRYVLFATSYDAKMSTVAMHTSVRVVCNNTLQFATQQNGSPRVTVSHNKELDVNRVKDDLGLTVDWENFQQKVDSLTQCTVSQEDAADFYARLFYGDAVADDEDLICEPKVISRIADMYNILEQAPGQDLPTSNGTAWGLVNSITYLFDHSTRAHSDENRFNNAQFGQAANKKQQAFELALDRFVY